MPQEHSVWDHITDHPKVAGVLALLAFAATFSPKASALAAWVCVLLAWVLALMVVAGIPAVKTSRRPWVPILLAATVLGFGLFRYSSWLTTKDDEKKEAARAAATSVPIETAPKVAVPALPAQPEEIAAEVVKRIPKQRLRAWLQVVDATNPTPHVVAIKIKNLGQIPAFDITLTPSFELDRLKLGRQPLNVEVAKLRYIQTASGGEFSINLGTDTPAVRHFLDESRPEGNFSIRVYGDIEYRDTETQKPHLLKVCYSDLGFAVTVNNNTPMFECSEAGLNVSK